MLTHEENEFLCRTGPKTPMGRNLRRYWWPALLSADLPGKGRACAPRRVRIFGEDMVAFRGDDGAVRMVEERCPHRGASLAIGVVEDCGIRCLFHGWKIGGDGSVLDAPNVSRGEVSGGPIDGIKGRAFPVREAGGIIWTYCGPAELEPPFMDYRWFDTPAQNRWVVAQIIDANFVQVIEGSIDPAHLAVLHQDSMRKVSVAVDPSTTSSVLGNLAPRIEVEPSEFGFRAFTTRKEGDGGVRVRPTLYVAPASIFIPRSPRKAAGGLITVTPIDDYRSLQMLAMWDEEEAIGLEPMRSEMLGYFGVSEDVMAAFGIDRENCDRPGKPTLENCFLQDRAAISSGDSFTGLPDFVPEDVAMAVSQGPIADRSREHLVKSDVAVVNLRKTLMASARAVLAGGTPFALGGDVDFHSICAHEYSVPSGQSWRDAAPRHR